MSHTNRERVSNNTDDNDNTHNNNNNNNNNNNSSSSASSRSGSFNANYNYSTKLAADSSSFQLATTEKSDRSTNIGRYDKTLLSSSSSSSSSGGNQLINNNNNNNNNNTNKDNKSSSSSSCAQPASSSHRLSSIEILNENRQRQLQFKQQESFKLHIEQRQKLIQQQQRESNDDNNLGVTYQVNTSAPDFMASALADNNKSSSTTSRSTSANSTRPTSAATSSSLNNNSNKPKVFSSNSVGSAINNPFDDEFHKEKSSNGNSVAGIIKRPGSARGDKRQSATVSGKSGFLSALMDEASFESNQLDRSEEELVTNVGSTVGIGRKKTMNDSLNNNNFTQGRYNNITAVRDYNYDDPEPDKRPFYRKDFATLLQECRASRKLVILIVAVALLLDNMLLTSVVPIIPFDLLKNRMERKHAELKLQQKQLNNNRGFINGSSSNGRMGKGKGRGNGNGNGQREDEDDDGDEEMARFIDKSIASAKNRYSGSVFHPKVIKQSKLNIGNKNVDDDDDQEVNDNDKDDDGDGDGNDDENKSNADDDDDDDDNGPASERFKSKGRANNNNMIRRPAERMQQKNQSSVRSQSIKNQNDRVNDDYEEITDEQNSSPISSSSSSMKNIRMENSSNNQDPNDRRNEKTFSSSSMISSSKKLSNLKSSETYNNNNNNVDDDDNDNDDEDLDNSKKWTKLKNSLISAARSSKNDTEVLGNTCLNIVFASGDLYANNKDMVDNDDDDDVTDSIENNDNLSRREKQTLSSNGNTKQSNRMSRDKTNDLTKQQQKRDRRSPKIKAPKLVNRPTVIRPQPSTTTPISSLDADGKATELSGGGKEDSNKEAEVDDMTSVSHQDIVDESFEVGVMFASKPIVQAFANPFIGTLTNKVGFTIPMFTGFVIMFISTLVFAFGSTYSTLFVARAIQGVGSACTSVAGMSMLADRFPDDAERGNAMAIALGGLALGVVIGPPFGGFMYEFVGRSSPFIVLSFLALFDGLLQLLVLQPRVTKSQEEGASLMTLIKDPYILVAAGAITFANTGIAILEPALPLWMMDTMQAKNWEQGVAFLPAALSYMFGTNLFGNLGHKIGRWRSTMIGLVIIGCSLLLIPFASRVEHLIIPNGAIGFAMGMVDSTMMPMLGYLVDIRHTSVYGSVYAIGDVAFCASFAFGPALSGTLVELIGFEGLIITTAMICFCFAPLLFLLRNPPARQLNEAQLQEQSTLRYVNYNHLDSPDEEAHLTDYKSKQTEKNYVR